MFTETKQRVTLLKDDTKGEWLQDAFDALGVNAPKAAEEMGANDKGRRLNLHITDKSHLGNSFYKSLKNTYPRINLNYIIAGELPILLTPQPDADQLRSTLAEIRNKANQSLGE